MAKTKSSNRITSYAEEDAKWRAESDLRTLIEAEQIEKDPKRIKAARELAKTKMLEVAAVAAEGESEDC